MCKHPNYMEATFDSMYKLWEETNETITSALAPCLAGKKGLLILGKSFVGARIMTCIDDANYFEMISENTENVLKGWYAAMLGYDDVSQLTQ
jgi:hypothetical protein